MLCNTNEYDVLARSNLHAMRGSRHVFFQARYLQPTLAHLRLAHLPPTMVKRWAHINETEFKILGRMRKLGYASKDIQAVLGRSKSWVTKNTKRLGKTFTKKFVKCRPGPKNRQHLPWVPGPGRAGPGGRSRRRICDTGYQTAHIGCTAP